MGSMKTETIKKLWARHKPGSVLNDHLSRPAVADRLQRPTFRAGTGRPQAMKPCCPFWSCSGWGLHEGYVTILLRELLPHDFTLTTGIPVRRCVSVALSLWLPTPDVIRHPRPMEPGLSSHAPKACAIVCLTQSNIDLMFGLNGRPKNYSVNYSVYGFVFDSASSTSSDRPA